MSLVEMLLVAAASDLLSRLCEVRAVNLRGLTVSYGFGHMTGSPIYEAARAVVGDHFVQAMEVR